MLRASTGTPPPCQELPVLQHLPATPGSVRLNHRTPTSVGSPLAGPPHIPGSTSVPPPGTSGAFAAAVTNLVQSLYMSLYIHFSAFILSVLTDTFTIVYYSMPPAVSCSRCGQSFARVRALRRHARVCQARGTLRSPELSLASPAISVDVPEAATHRESSSQTTPSGSTSGDSHLPLDAVTPSRRISRARRQLISPLLYQVIRTTNDVGVGTHSAPRVCGACSVCPPQVPDMRPAPFRGVAFVQDTIVQLPELVTRVCRCHTCVLHSTWARRRHVTPRGHSAGSLPLLEFVRLPLPGIPDSSPDDRRQLRLEHLRNPASATLLCGCYRCVGHRVLDLAAESVARMERSRPPLL